VHCGRHCRDQDVIRDMFESQIYRKCLKGMCMNIYGVHIHPVTRPFRRRGQRFVLNLKLVPSILISTSLNMLLEMSFSSAHNHSIDDPLPCISTHKVSRPFQKFRRHFSSVSSLDKEGKHCRGQFEIKSTEMMHQRRISISALKNHASIQPVLQKHS
jgi:hypothetical protein